MLMWYLDVALSAEAKPKLPCPPRPISKVRSETWRMKSLPKPPEVREIHGLF